jgi:hypothetical protein
MSKKSRTKRSPKSKKSRTKRSPKSKKSRTKRSPKSKKSKNIKSRSRNKRYKRYDGLTEDEEELAQFDKMLKTDAAKKKSRYNPLPYIKTTALNAVNAVNAAYTKYKKEKAAKAKQAKEFADIDKEWNEAISAKASINN